MSRVFLLASLLTLALNVNAAGRIIILNSDKPGTGFNDPTPATPIGGNNGTTLGQQRLNVFAEAARRWQNALDIKVPVHVTATFSPINTPGQPCTATAAVLGQAGPTYVEHSFPGAPRQNVWYSAALANQFRGVDRDSGSEIFAQFNAAVDDATCLGETGWYYGLDGNHGSDMDLFVVVLHELAHGLGLTGAMGGSDFRDNRPGIFNTHIHDLTAGLWWDQMSPEQRRASVTNTGNLVWTGERVRERAPSVLSPLTTLTVTQPASLAGDYDVGFATFGPSASTAAFSGRIVQAMDASTSDGPATTDGCTAFTNAGEVAGKIALVDRGTCAFQIKALNAQAAGAAGLVIANVPSTTRTETCSPPDMSPVSDDEVRIPVISVATNKGDSIKQQVSAGVEVRAMLRVDPSQRAGASREGYVRLYAPCSEEPQSSTYHWDVMTRPNLLMEPSINSDLLHGLDLALYQLLDLGWSLPPRTGRTFTKR